MLIDKYLEFEKKNNLFEKKIEGLQYWSYIRFYIFHEINRQKDNTLPITVNDNERKIKISYDLNKDPLRSNQCYDLLVLNIKRKVKIGDFYEDIYTDPWLKEIPYSKMVLDMSFSDDCEQPVSTENIKYIAHLDILTKIKLKLLDVFYLIKYFFDLKTKNEIHILANRINMEFSIALNEEIIIGKVKSYYTVAKKMAYFYKKLFLKIKPKAIIEICSYQSDRIIINEIAKKMGIKVIEMQHGIINNYNIAYNFPEGAQPRYFPDYLFLFGDYWHKSARFPIHKENIFAVGFPYYENEFKNNKVNDVAGKNKKIIFISQQDVGAVISRIAVDLANILRDQEYKIFYKLHPGEYMSWEKLYPDLLKCPNIYVIDNNEHSLYYYFNQVFCQIGAYSMALYEGLGFHLKTFILNVPRHEHMEDLYKSKIAILVNNASEIIKYLNQDINMNGDNNIFWTKNSIKNIKVAIDQVINGKYIE